MAFNFYPYTMVGYDDLCIAVESWPSKPFYCVGYWGDDRCNILISTDTMKFARYKLNMFQTNPTKARMKYIFSFCLCDIHDSPEVRAKYIEAWCQIFSSDEFGSPISRSTTNSPRQSTPLSKKGPIRPSVVSLESEDTVDSDIEHSRSDTLSTPSPLEKRRGIVPGRATPVTNSSSPLAENLYHVQPARGTSTIFEPSNNSTLPAGHNESDTRYARQQRRFSPPAYEDILDPAEILSHGDIDNDILKENPGHRSESSTPVRKQSGTKVKPNTRKPNIRRESSDFDIHENISTLLRSRSHPSSKVYIMETTYKGVQLAKIGITTQTQRKRRAAIVTCEPFKEAKEHAVYYTLHHARAEELAHNELSHFRWTEDCSCEKKHTEWFKVSPEVADQCVKRWIEVTNLAFDQYGSISDLWSSSLGEFEKTMPSLSLEEIRSRENGDLETHHKLRHERYHAWIIKTKRSMLNNPEIPEPRHIDLRHSFEGTLYEQEKSEYESYGDDDEEEEQHDYEDGYEDEDTGYESSAYIGKIPGAYSDDLH